MSGDGVAEGQGITMTAATLALILNLLNLNQDGPEVTDINCSDQGTTGFEEYLPSTLKEGGTVAWTVNWNLEDQAALYAAVGVKDTWTITYPFHDPVTNATAATDVLPMYLKKVTKTGQKGQTIEGTLNFKVAGTPTFTNEQP